MYRSKRVLSSLLLLTVACADARSQNDPDGGGAGATDGATGDGAPGADAAGLDCSSGLTGWHPLGDPLSAWSQAMTPANGPSVDVDPVTGEIYVAWLEGIPADAHVRRWDGSNWLQLGNPISVNPDNTPVYSVHVAARAGEVVLGHAENGGETVSGFYAQAYNGAWQQLGGGDLSTQNVSVTGGATRFDDDGNVIVAWSQSASGGSGRRIQARRFDGAAYIPLNPEMGGIPGPGALALTPSVTFAADGTEIVAFSESGVRVFERNADDTGWDPLGGDEISAIDSLNGGHSPYLARSQTGQIFLALAEFDNGTSTANGYLMELSGSTWQRRDGVIDVVPGEHAYVKGMTVSGDGRPVVAATEGAGANELYIQRHNGSAFLDVGTMPLSAYSGGASVSAAALATDLCGRIIVAFTEEDASDERNLHVYRFYE